MMIECTYEFTPPGGKARIKIHGMQPYSPGQTRKVKVWKLDVPDEYAARLERDAEFDSWGVVIRTLANLFCGGEEQAAKERLVITFDQRPKL